MTADEYTEEWEKCVELALTHRVIATTRALELGKMRKPEGDTEVWEIPVSACLVFHKEIKLTREWKAAKDEEDKWREARDGEGKTHYRS